MHTETYIADDNTTLISKSFRDLKKYLDMVSYGQISIPYLTRFKKVIINNARSDFCVDEVKSLLSRGILQDAEEVEIKNPDDEVSTPMRCIAPIKVVSKTERSSEKYLQELPVKGFVLEAVPLSSFEHKANEPYADRANKGLFTKPPIHWQMMPKEYFGLRFAFKARA